MLVNFSLSIQHLLSIDLHDCLTLVNSGVYCTGQCETARRTEKETVADKCPDIRLFLGSFVCLFVCLFSCPINSPRSLCKRLSFLLKTERVTGRVHTHPDTFENVNFFFLLKMYASTRCVFKWFVLLFIFPVNTKTLKRYNHSRIPYRGCAVR